MIFNHRVIINIYLTASFLLGVVTTGAQERSLYWIGAVEGEESRFSTIFRYSLDRATIDTLVQGRKIESNPRYSRRFYGLAVDSLNRRIYWTDTGGTNPDGSINIGAILRARLEDGNIDAIFKGVVCGLGIPTDIELDPARERLYWGVETDCPLSLWAADFEGYSSRDWRPLPTNGPHSVVAIEVDARNQMLYWVNINPLRNPLGIYRASLNDTILDERIVSGNICDIAIGHALSKLYWVSCNSGTIRRANLDGTMTEDIHVGQAEISKLTVDQQGKKIYWTERSAGKIRRANLDGSDVEDLLSGLVMPTGLALGFGQGIHVGIDPKAAFPGRSGLQGIYPNPVRETATITFALPEQADVTMEIYDPLGRRVEVLLGRTYPPGRHQVEWTPQGHANGAYLIRMTSGTSSSTLPLILQR